MGDELLRVAEAARVLQIHPATLREWTEHGLVPSTRTAGGHRRYRRADLDAYLAGQREAS
jgi:excisionase family DNA binding protein